MLEILLTISKTNQYKGGVKVKRSILSCFVVLVSMLIACDHANAITNGEPDNERHPYVGLLVFDVFVPGYGNYPAWRCSGTLIAPNIVLTAGHCTDGAVAARVWFDEDVTYNNVPFPLYPFGGPDSGAVEGTPHTHPDYRSAENPYGGGNGLPAFSYRDIGIVVLDEPVYMDEYAELPAAGQVDTLKNKTDIDFVGYGFQEQIPGGGLPPYYQWTGLRIRIYAPSQLISGEFVFSAEFMKLALNPGGETGGFCFGDSGGPDLLGGTNTVLGVNSFLTNANCSGVGYSSRVDIPEVLAWISGFNDD